MSKLTTVKIKYDDGNLSGQIPIGMEAENVLLNNNTTVQDKIASIDNQIENINNRVSVIQAANYDETIEQMQADITSLSNEVEYSLPFIEIHEGQPFQDETKIYKKGGDLYYYGNGRWEKLRTNDAVGIDHIDHNSDYTVTFVLTNGETYTTQSLRGARGQDGHDVGEKGIGIRKVYQNLEDKTLTLYFTGEIDVGDDELRNYFTTEPLYGPQGVGIKKVQETPEVSNSIRIFYTEYLPEEFGEDNYEIIDNERYSYQDVSIYIEGGGSSSPSEEFVSISRIERVAEGDPWYEEGAEKIKIYLNTNLDQPALVTGNLKGQDGNDGRGIDSASFDEESSTLTLNFDKPLENGSTSYTTPPLGGGGIASINYAVPQNYINKVQNFNGTDYTQVFKAMLADAKENHKFIIIPNRSYKLNEQLWSDDSVVLADLGIYPNKKLIISKDLDDGIPFERAVCEFNPYLDIKTNARTGNLSDDRYYRSPFLIPPPKGTDTVEPNPQPFVRRRLQGVCYDDYHDVFIFGFTEVRNRNSYFAPALIMFFKLNQRNIFEYVGKGYAKYAGHLNSMCFRLEDKKTGDAATDTTEPGNKIGCIYAACGLQSNDTIPSASKTKDEIKQGLNIGQTNPDDQIGKINGQFLTDEQVFQVYGGSKFEIARIPIIVNSDSSGKETFSIPTKYRLIHKNPSISVDSKTFAAEDGVGYNPGSGSSRAYYDRVHYFCGVISDNIYDNFDTSKFNRDLGSMNRSVYGLTYDNNNNIFYIYTTVFEAMISGNKIVRFRDNDKNKNGIQIAYFKAFTLKDNKWTVIPESERPNIFQSENPNFNNTQLPFKKGFINVTQTDEQVKNKTQIFADAEHSYDPVNNTFSDLDELEAQGPIVINDQLVWCYYISKQISNFGRFNNGTLFVQFNYHTGQVKKIYRIPCQYPYHEVQCLVRGKNGRIYMMNQLGKSDTQGNRVIRVTQLVFDKDVSALPENPYTDPKNLRVYPRMKTANSNNQEVIDFNYLTEIGSYVFMGDVAHSNSSAAAVKEDFNKFKIINSPVDSYYFTLYVLSIGGWFRFQILLSEHGQIYVRNGWISDNTGVVSWNGWRQLAETSRPGASRVGDIYTAGMLIQYDNESGPRALRFMIPYATNNVGSRIVPTVIGWGNTVLRQAGKTWSRDYLIKQVTENGVTRLQLHPDLQKIEITTSGWGYNVLIQLNSGKTFTNFQAGAVGIVALGARLQF